MWENLFLIMLFSPTDDKLSTKQELGMAALGGVVSAITTSPVELVMIQQQR